MSIISDGIHFSVIITVSMILLTVCSMNVHKRCQKNVANNCGINTKQMAQILDAMGISTYKLTPKRTKVQYIDMFLFVFLERQ